MASNHSAEADDDDTDCSENETDRFEATYIFSPSDSTRTNGQSSRKRTFTANAQASKRQKVSKQVKLASTAVSPFVPLLEGKEPAELVDIRLNTFQSFWSQRAEHIEAILHEADAAILDEIQDYIRFPPSIHDNGKIPTGFVVAGPSVASHTRLFHQVQDKVGCDDKHLVMLLDSSTTTNLKTALKTIVSIVDGDNDEEEAHTNIKKRLPYDLQMVHDHMREKGAEQLTLIFCDSEALDTAVLASLLMVLSSWSDRIPMILLFGIATSVDLFEDRLPRSVIRLLQGKTFHVQGTENILEKILETAFLQETVWLGPNVCRMITDRARDHIQSPQSFVAALEILMLLELRKNFVKRSGIYPLSEGKCSVSYSNPLLTITRFCEGELATGNARAVRSLLNDDNSLIAETRKQLRRAQSLVFNLLSIIGPIHELLALIKPSSTRSWSDVYTLAISGSLRESALMRELLLSIKHLPASTLREVISVLENLIPEHAQIWQDHALNLERAKPDPAQSKKCNQETSAAIVKIMSSHLDENLPTAANAPMAMFLHEIFLPSLSSPSNSAFTPRPRVSIERALSHPHHYLGCECCENLAEGALSATQPPTAVLWQLLQEGGATVNVADLLRAFEEVMKGRRQEIEGDDDGDAEGHDEEKRLSALFYRGLAELKYLGWVRRAGGAGRRGDCLVKGGWKGL